MKFKKYLEMTGAASVGGGTMSSDVAPYYRNVFAGAIKTRKWPDPIVDLTYPYSKKKKRKKS